MKNRFSLIQAITVDAENAIKYLNILKLVK